MKIPKAWRLGIGEMHIVPATRHRSPSRRPPWIIILVSLVCLSLIGAYVFPPRRYAACYLFASSVCSPFKQWLPPVPARLLTDDEIASRVVIRDILNSHPIQPKNPKIAFMFLTPGPLPFEKLWEKFFLGHEGRYTIYIHASREKPEHLSPLFVDREIHSEKVVWGKISMVDAEKRLLANALEDADNQHFILLSDSCVPLHNFDYVFNYLMESNISFVDCFEDPGPHGTGRYSEHMLPEVEKKVWRKGAQWFTVKRQHAVLVLADSLYYSKFKFYCKMVDPNGIANWSVTHVDWSEGKWHPKAYRAQDVSFELLKNITAIDESLHVTSDEKREIQRRPCFLNGSKRPCYLFARKFYPEALNNLMQYFSNYTSI
ncbi:glycosyltransferase BC10-like isoform X2 [Magnolia sinica]|uniref:glycosyltransferase BC10-like isoform X2 n=1 Tax=Magnolia sinica TaxID=86752 RepID=UPI002659C9E7|nr:glycosyltransferase BC10-like isoform X2 [Magnolia sinica]